MHGVDKKDKLIKLVKLKQKARKSGADKKFIDIIQKQISEIAQNMIKDACE